MSTEVTRSFAFKALGRSDVYGVTIDDNRAIIRAKEASDRNPTVLSVAWILRNIVNFNSGLVLFMATIYGASAKLFGLIAGVISTISITCTQPATSDYIILVISIIIFTPDIISIGRYRILAKRVNYAVFDSYDCYYSYNDSIIDDIRAGFDAGATVEVESLLYALGIYGKYADIGDKTKAEAVKGVNEAIDAIDARVDEANNVSDEEDSVGADMVRTLLGKSQN